MRTLTKVWLLTALLAAALPAPAAAPAKAKKAASPVLKAQKAARRALDGMVEAFIAKDAARFLAFVAEDFTGDKAVLDTSLRTSFSKFTAMELRVTPNNITTGPKNKDVALSVTYTRAYTDVKTARRMVKTGTAQFVFRAVDGTPKLYSTPGASMFELP